MKSLIPFGCWAVWVLFGACVGFAADADEPPLRALFEEGDRITERINALRKEYQKLSKDIKPRFRKYLPSPETPYGKYKWNCGYSGGRISLEMRRHEDNKQLAWGNCRYHAELTDAVSKDFPETFMGMPTKRFKGKWLFVLVGRMELHILASDKSFESDEKLNEILSAFDLEGLAKL